MERLVIPRLEKLAFEASYKELLSNLLLCREHRPEEKQVELVAFSSIISACTFLKSENVIAFVRNRLNHYLLPGTTMNDKMRNKYLEKFYQNCLLNDYITDIWVFLECVLDDTIKELETHVAFPGTEPNPKLIPAIENNASFLTNLKLNFKSMKGTTPIEKTNQMISSLSSLEYLTRLSLDQLPELHRSMLKFVGSSCPLLTHLSITGFRIMPHDVLLILLGDLAETLFPQYGEKKPWTEDDALRLLQVPPQLLTPLCFNLQNLRLDDVDWDTNVCSSCAIVTFCLRHLPSLEKMDGLSTSIGVQSFISWNTLADEIRSEGINGEEQQNRLDKILLQESLEPTLDAESERQMTTEFEAICNHIITSRLKLTDEETFFFSRSTFSGTLALTKLDCLSLQPAISLPAIGILCPHLKEVLFRELWPDWQPFLATSDEELEESFRDWPELETITLSKMTPRFIKAVLKAFGPKLKSLAFDSCNNISLADLIPCTNLESLKFIKFSSIALHEESEQNAALTAEDFLPELVSLESSICLGPFASQLFEHKSKLTSVTLNCCHIGAKRYPVSGWSSLPKMWPHLETLHIRSCVELTLPMIPNIVSNLTKVKVLSLPENVAKSDLAMVAGIVDEFTNRLAPINLSFVKEPFGEMCPLLGSVDYYNDDEEGADGWGGGNFALGFHDHFDDALLDVGVEDEDNIEDIY